MILLTAEEEETLERGESVSNLLFLANGLLLILRVGEEATLAALNSPPNLRILDRDLTGEVQGRVPPLSSVFGDEAGKPNTTPIFSYIYIY